MIQANQEWFYISHIWYFWSHNFRPIRNLLAKSSPKINILIGLKSYENQIYLNLGLKESIPNVINPILGRFVDIWRLFPRLGTTEMSVWLISSPITILIQEFLDWPILENTRVVKWEYVQAISQMKTMHFWIRVRTHFNCTVIPNIKNFYLLYLREGDRLGLRIRSTIL